MIQRRFDGSVSFDRTWSECARGFGNKTGEYWLGLNYIHRLTTSAGQLLRVDLDVLAFASWSYLRLKKEPCKILQWSVVASKNALCPT